MFDPYQERDVLHRSSIALDHDGLWNREMNRPTPKGRRLLDLFEEFATDLKAEWH